jgi:hypothetical protein
MTEPEQETTGRTVVGMFPTRAEAESAIRELKTAGFTDHQIGVATQDDTAAGDPASVRGAAPAEGAATGALSGGVVGGLIGLLGSILVPGLGPLVVGGVLASTLAGAGIGAATGGLIGALMGIGIPEADARHFETGLRAGGTLVTVSAGRRTSEALGILQRHGMDFGPTRHAPEPEMGTAYAGRERRVSTDVGYAGPDRRVAAV